MTASRIADGAIACGPLAFNEAYIRMYPESRMPRGVTFIVTEDCNLKCSYCYQHNKTKRRMTAEIGRRAVDMLFEHDAAGSRYINPNDAECLILDFIGGEPFLEIGIIDDIVGYFLDRAISQGHRWATRYMISMSTNGTLYFRPEVQRFLTRYAGRVSLGVTVDGNKRLHDACRVYPDGKGSYDEAAAAFRHIVATHGQQGTKLTLAPANIGNLFEAARDMFVDFDIPWLQGNCVFEEGWTTDHARTMYEQLKQLSDWLLEDERYRRHGTALLRFGECVPMSPDRNDNWCGGTGKMLAIGVDGLIYPCLRYAPSSLPQGVEPIVIGDVWRGIEHTEEQRQCVDCLNCITRRSQSSDECFNCPIAQGCAWCSAYNYERNGTADKRCTYICIMHRSRALATAYFWNRVCRAEKLPDRYPLHISREWALGMVNEAEFDMLVRLASRDE